MKDGVYEIKLTVPQKDIYYISWNVDACEGLGFLQTDEASNGLVTIFTPLCLIEDMLSLIEGLKAEGVSAVISEIRVLEEKSDD